MLLCRKMENISAFPFYLEHCDTRSIQTPTIPLLERKGPVCEVKESSWH